VDEPANPHARRLAEPAPADFKRYGGVETIPRLAQRYGRSETTIRRWRVEHGFVGQSGFDVASTGFRRVPQNGGEQLPDDTIQKRAATWLRKEGQVGNLFRTDIEISERTAETWADRYNWRRRDGRPAHPIPGRGEGHYMVDGHGVVSEARMIELARAIGFPE